MLGITMGDASGVGPEIILKSFLKNKFPLKSIVIGDLEILQACKKILKYDVSLHKTNDLQNLKKNAINIHDTGILQNEDLAIGQSSKKSGAAALKYVETATQLALNNQIKAVVTLPMNKEATRLSEKKFTGHTEFIAKLCGQDNYTMMLATDQLIVTHVSTHIALKEAVCRITTKRVYDVIKLTHNALQQLRPQSRIAIAGLNPHAGENGAFGNEELEIILPVVAKAKKNNYNVSGPFPPDTIFLSAIKGQYDAVIAMYHDQGHIPMKMIDFEGAVNVTLGLPIIRTSVDHGTAFDIAYKGIASEKSFVNAWKMAEKLSE